MGNEFDWKAFEAELEKSSVLCATGKADIKRAIARGQGATLQPAAEQGQVWQDLSGGLYVISGDTLICLRTGYPCKSLSAKIEVHNQMTFKAATLPEYLAAGGKL